MLRRKYLKIFANETGEILVRSVTVEELDGMFRKYNKSPLSFSAQYESLFNKALSGRGVGLWVNLNAVAFR
jgi:hypothetical protein